MHQPVQGITVDEHAAPDSGTDGDVDQIFQAGAGPPSMLGQGGRIDVGIKADGTGKASRTGLMMSVWLQPGFGVLPMDP